MIGLLVSRESVALPFTLVIVLLSVIGILMSVQMAIVLGRFTAQQSFRECHLRGIESCPTSEPQTGAASTVYASIVDQLPLVLRHHSCFFVL